MDNFYKPQNERKPDSQYQGGLGYVFNNGEMLKETPQGIGALTCFGTLPRWVFSIEEGVPLITERACNFWPMSIGEMNAFVNGEHTIDGLERYGCNFWKDYRGKGTKFGLAPDDLGPGSYGSAFHDYEIPSGGTLNQFERLIEMIRLYPHMRTHLVTPWKPYYTAASGPSRKVIVAPCHGWLHFRVMNGKLHMRMDQRSGDLPIGVPSNMIQYAALLLMICQVTGYPPGNYVHTIADAHIYENQFDAARELVKREPRVFPILRLDPSVKNLFDFRPKHFSIEEYNPHPGMKVPYSP